MGIRDLIGEEVNISHANKSYETRGILLDIDAGGVLLEVTNVIIPPTGSPLPYKIGDIAYIKENGFHIHKTVQMLRNSKLKQLSDNDINV
mgnify:CR=1 FL=1